MQDLPPLRPLQGRPGARTGTKEEVEQWFERDPLKLARAQLLEEGITEEQIAAAEQATTALIEHAIENALAAPYPDPELDAATEFSA